MRQGEPHIRSIIFDGLPDFLRTRAPAVEVRALLADHGLEPDLPGAADQFVPLSTVAQVLERAALLADRPCLGVEYAQAFPIGGAGSLGFLLTHAPTVREAIDNLIRYIHAFTTPMYIAFVAENGIGYVEWKFPIEFTTGMPQYVSFAVATIILRLRHVAGSDWSPLQLDLIHPALPEPAIWRPIFGPRVRFDAAHNRMWIDATTLAKRNDGSNPHLYRTARAAGDAELARTPEPLAAAQAGVVARLRSFLSTSMEQGIVDLDGVANGLGLEPRQLQYDLEQWGTSFSDELNTTRRLRAEHLLATTDRSMTAIASALGFAELSSFTRACRVAWFGMSPSKFRARVRSDGRLPPPHVRPDPEDTGA
jgi:AraC-like DNA-binding protein